MYIPLKYTSYWATLTLISNLFPGMEAISSLVGVGKVQTNFFYLSPLHLAQGEKHKLISLKALSYYWFWNDTAACLLPQFMGWISLAYSIAPVQFLKKLFDPNIK